MIKIGIFFGGISREREVSFAGGRTVFDNLNKLIFEPIPIFVDSFGQWIHIDWSYLYKGTIRDFYPAPSRLSALKLPIQVYAESLEMEKGIGLDALAQDVGTKINPSDISQLIDIAFLALHGEGGEDGQIQGLLEYFGVPYTGSGILASAIGMDKSVQKKFMRLGQFACPPMIEIKRKDWTLASMQNIYAEATRTIGLPLVVRPANQGSSIGVSILKKEDDLARFEELVNRAFFRIKVDLKTWKNKSLSEKIHYLQDITDLRSGIGFPMYCGDAKYYNPDELLQLLDTSSEKTEYLTLDGYHSEQKVILEGFIEGKEFSCIVLRNEHGESTALPPTEIIKKSDVFDYKSKYLPGLSHKETPIKLPMETIEKIRKECVRLFEYFEFKTYARIDGFITTDETIILNDPNTTSGMMPSSFFFHQAAEIGLNPSQFLTFIIKKSVQERIDSSLSPSKFRPILKKLEENLQRVKSTLTQRKKIGILMGGYSFERHISMESGRNIFEKLSSSKDYEPIPLFLVGNKDEHRFFRLPIQLMLKDNADDIRTKLLNWERHPLLDKIRLECKDLLENYAGEANFDPKEWTYKDFADQLSFVFIALHGRPGEDGTIQQSLEKYGIPYNGSGVKTSATTINKYETLQKLKKEGFCVADQAVFIKNEYTQDRVVFIQKVLDSFSFPFILKPIDDGCSSAVKIIRDSASLSDYLDAIFRETEEINPDLRQRLKLDWNEEFPAKSEILAETLIEKGDAKHFLEITGGFLTHLNNGELVYEMFEPSEALTTGEVLSLEEKFLAGEGQNITPARYDKDPARSKEISIKVQKDLQRAAQILNVEGYARIDAFVKIYPDGKVETIIIEVNSLPGMTPATCIFHQSALNGHTPFQFIEKIIEFGIQRHKMN